MVVQWRAIYIFIIKKKFCFRVFVAYQKSCKDSSEGSVTPVTPSPQVWTLTLLQCVVTTKKRKGSHYTGLHTSLSHALHLMRSLCDTSDSRRTAQDRGHTGQEVTPIWPSQTSAFPGSTECERICLPASRHKRLRFDPWVGKITWRREWHATPVFLPGKSHGQRSLEGYSLWGCKESGMTEFMTSALAGVTCGVRGGARTETGVFISLPQISLCVCGRAGAHRPFP